MQEKVEAILSVETVEQVLLVNMRSAVVESYKIEIKGKVKEQSKTKKQTKG